MVAVSHQLRFCLAVLFSGVLIYGDLHLSLFDNLRSGMSLVLVPFRAVAAFPAQSYQAAAGYLSSRRSLLAEKNALEEKISQDQARLQSLDFFVRQNAELRQALGVAPPAAGKWVGAQLLRNISQPLADRIYLNRGIVDGVTPGTAVVDETGVIGQVIRVDADTSVVSLLTSVDQWITARVRRNNLQIILHGAGGDDMVVEYAPNSMDVQVGDELIAAGGVFPPGYPIGEIESVRTGAVYLEAQVRLFSNFLDNNFVLLYVINDEADDDNDTTGGAEEN